MDLIGLTKRKNTKITNGWELAKIMFTDMLFIKQLTTLNLNAISHQQFESIEKWLKNLTEEEHTLIKNNKVMC